MAARFVKTHEWSLTEIVDYGEGFHVKVFECKHCGAEKRVGLCTGDGQDFITYYAHAWSPLEAVRRKPMPCNHREPV